VPNVYTHEVLKLAVGGNAKAVCESLRQLGKRVSLRWVYFLCEPNADVRRANPYESFWLLFRALWQAHREGAELLYEDFRARVESLRSEGNPEGDWFEQVVRCERENSEALQAAILRRDARAIRKELSDSIREQRRLLEMAGEADCLKNVA
jgi:hypothetical protein